ncbi:hypothetical protein QTI66_05110 [Variovorax sp. J22R133]|uniref:hypothetical protein n=1 Tax=Variovorax brevis TaxID=3053503 RepID=UPI0025781660|nr:hypothetical protein [Variovorax sp. J22R133]MDM0111517.1 hypothetical protein [Variovorax sp. J22R133]
MKVLSDWRSIRLWESGVERELHRRYSLRAHGIFIGSFTLLLMWAVSAVQMHWGGQSLAVRYLVTLGVGYLAYLGVLRWWAQRLVEGREAFNADVIDPGLVDFGDGVPSAGASTAEGVGVSDVASGAFEVVGSVDEGAIIVVPVLAIFAICAAIAFGAGALVLLYFGSEALLTVAIEIAFSYVSARSVFRLAREGWLSAAVRLTWRPLLGAVMCAVLLGAVIDHFMPEVNSLPEAVRVMLRAH